MRIIAGTKRGMKPTAALTAQLLLDAAITLVLAIGASSLMGVVNGGPVGVTAGIAISYKIEKWYKLTNKEEVVCTSL